MNAGNPKVIEFIYRRFANTEAKWDDGNCYWFAEILVTRFPDLEIVYFPVPGHFMAKGKFEGEEYVYDINGGRKINKDENKNKTEDEYFSLAWIKKNDRLWWERLMRDCVE